MIEEKTARIDVLSIIQILLKVSSSVILIHESLFYLIFIIRISFLHQLIGTLNNLAQFTIFFGTSLL